MNTPAALIAMLVLAVPAHAQWSLHLLADNTTPVPGGTGTFSTFGAPSFAGGHVVFIANNRDGVYTNATGPFTLVANRNTSRPGGGTFAGGFDVVSFDGGTPTFVAGDGVTGRGVYAGAAPGIDRIADTTTAIPGGGGQNFSIFGADGGMMARSASSVSFLGSSAPGGPAGLGGVYLWNSGGLSRVVDTSTPMPGTAGNFAGFGQAAISGQNALFVGSSAGAATAGIYSSPLAGGPIATLADFTTPMPGGVGNFKFFNALSPDGDNLAFLGSGAGQVGGVYARINSSLLRIADTNTPSPEGDLFSSFGFCALSGNTVVFAGQHATGFFGLYAWRDGIITKIVSPGETINGHVVTNAFVSPEGLEGNTVAFELRYTTGETALYTATTIPAPASLTLLAVATVLAPRRRRP